MKVFCLWTAYPLHGKTKIFTIDIILDRYIFQQIHQGRTLIPIKMIATLYHHIPMRVGEFGYRTCAYSNPAFGQMFKMNARTEEDGKVHVVVATVYDSLELMYGDLCLDLERHARSGTFKYKKIKKEVLMDFL